MRKISQIAGLAWLLTVSPAGLLAVTLILFVVDEREGTLGAE
jgi:hypothetical protein